MPIRFEVPYDPAAIDPKRTYSVSARIVADGTLLLVNDTRHGLLTRGAPQTADLVLVAVTR